MMPMTGLPLPHSAVNAVGISATPALTLKPALFSCCCSSALLLLFLVAHFREAPDLQRDIAVHARAAIDRFQYGSRSGAARGRQLPNDSDDDESQQVTHRSARLSPQLT